MDINRINSRENSRLKAFRRAARGGARSELTLLEGPKLLRDALEAGVKIEMVAVDEAETAKREALLAACANTGAELMSLPKKLLAGISDVVTCQGIVALARPKFVRLEDLSPDRDTLLLIADAIQDPGNMGALVRSAAALGADAVILLPGCADPWGAKAVRGSAGACFRIPLLRSDPSGLFDQLRAWGLRSVALDSGGRIPLREYDFRGPCAIIVGSEGPGLSPLAISSADAIVRIPIAEGVESLNAAVAASIVLYVASIQRT